MRFLSYLVYKMYAIRKSPKQKNKTLMCLGFKLCELTWQDPKSFENLFLQNAKYWDQVG